MRTLIVLQLIGLCPIFLNAQSQDESPVTRLQAKQMGVSKIYTIINRPIQNKSYIADVFEYDTLGNLILWEQMDETGSETTSFIKYEYRDTTLQTISKCFTHRGFQHWEISYFDSNGRITRFADSTEIVKLITTVKSTDYVYYGDTTLIIYFNEDEQIVQTTNIVLKDGMGTEITQNLITGLTTTKEYGIYNSYKITTKQGDSIIYLKEVKYDSINRILKRLEYNQNIVKIFEYTYNPYTQQYINADKISGTYYNEYITYNNNRYRIVETTNNKKEIKTGRLDDETALYEPDCDCFCQNELMQAMPDNFESESEAIYDTITNNLLMRKVFKVNPANKEKTFAKTFFYDSNGLLIKLQESQYLYINYQYEFY